MAAECMKMILGRGWYVLQVVSIVQYQPGPCNIYNTAVVMKSIFTDAVIVLLESSASALFDIA